MKVSLYGILQEVKTMADRTYKVVFRTNEIPPQDAGILMSLVHKEGHCLFANVPLKEEDVPESKGEFKDEKSPSQRLRNVLWVYWDQQGKPDDFETFRRQKMEILIDYIKAKLD